MAIKLEDCPPSLHAAIMAQLEREGRGLPQTIVRYALAYQVCGEWRVGPETENRKLILQQVSRLQCQTGRTAFLASTGKATALCLKITRVTEPLTLKKEST